MTQPWTSDDLAEGSARGWATPDGRLLIRNPMDLPAAVVAAGRLPEEDLFSAATHLVRRSRELGMTASTVRKAASGASSLVQALSDVWDPVKHPRGHDGRFIEVGGRVRVLGKDGKPIALGRVEKINPSGTVKVRKQDGRSTSVPADRIEAASDIKAEIGNAAQGPSQADTMLNPFHHTMAIFEVRPSPPLDGESDRFTHMSTRAKWTNPDNPYSDTYEDRNIDALKYEIMEDGRTQVLLSTWDPRTMGALTTRESTPIVLTAVGEDLDKQLQWLTRANARHLLAQRVFDNKTRQPNYADDIDGFRKSLDMFHSLYGDPEFRMPDGVAPTVVYTGPTVRALEAEVPTDPDDPYRLSPEQLTALQTKVQDLRNVLPADPSQIGTAPEGVDDPLRDHTYLRVEMFLAKYEIRVRAQRKYAQAVQDWYDAQDVPDWDAYPENARQIESSKPPTMKQVLDPTEYRIITDNNDDRTPHNYDTRWDDLTYEDWTSRGRYRDSVTEELINQADYHQRYLDQERAKHEEDKPFAIERARKSGVAADVHPDDEGPGETLVAHLNQVTDLGRAVEDAVTDLLRQRGFSLDPVSVDDSIKARDGYHRLSDIEHRLILQYNPDLVDKYGNGSSEWNDVLNGYFESPENKERTEPLNAVINRWRANVPEHLREWVANADRELSRRMSPGSSAINYNYERQVAYKSVLRQLGVEFGAPTDVPAPYTWADGRTLESDDPQVRSLREGLAEMPTRLLRSSWQFDQKVEVKPTNRASRGVGRLNLEKHYSKGQVSTAIHEEHHAVENANRWVKRLEWALLSDIAFEGEPGQRKWRKGTAKRQRLFRPSGLANRYPRSGYRSDEKGIEDHLSNMYIGKVYGDRFFTEGSMGGEFMAHQNYELLTMTSEIVLGDTNDATASVRDVDVYNQHNRLRSWYLGVVLTSAIDHTGGTQ